jgi:O-antigen/teichoic acid export membrane protein
VAEPRPTPSVGGTDTVDGRSGPEVEADTAVNPGSTRRQALWTLLSQVFSSLANFSLTIAVARAVDATVGGAFTYAFLVFSLTLGLSRAITIEPLIIRFSAVMGAPRRRAIVQAAGASSAMGLLCGVISALAGLGVGEILGLALVMLLLVLPGHFLQDSWRSAAFAAGSPRVAAVNDAVRTAVQSVGIAACVISGTDVLAWYMLSWAAGSWAGALLGIAQFGRPGGPRASVSWLRQNTGLSVRLGSDYAINMGTSTITTSILAAMLGLAATGGLRFALSILGPIQILFGAASSFVVPLLARRLAVHGARSLWRPGMLVSLVCVGVSLVAVGVLLFLPDSLGRELLGDSWEGARAVMPAVGAGQCAIAVSIGAALVLKALSRADLLLKGTLVQAPLIFLLGVGGGLWLGIEGAAWGMALAQVVGAAITVTLARGAALRQPPSAG